MQFEASYSLVLERERYTTTNFLGKSIDSVS